MCERPLHRVMVSIIDVCTCRDAMKHEQQPEDIETDLTLYALGALDAAEAAAIEARLVAGDPHTTQALRDAERIVALLAYEIPAVAPPPRLKSTLMQRIHAETRDATPLPHMPFLDFEALTWQPTTDAGVSFHWLRRDSTTGGSAVFVRLEPGSRASAHRHHGFEDCLVIHGAFRDQQGEYHVGDFVSYPPGSEHRDFAALGDEPCIIFIVSSAGLEVLPAEQ